MFLSNCKGKVFFLFEQIFYHFPKFLNNEQIDYLMEMANLSLEEIQLKIVLNVIERKRNDMEIDVNKQIMNKIIEYSNNRRKSQINNIITDRNKINNNIDNETNKIYKTFRKIYNKYEEAFKVSYMKGIEEIRTNQIINELKINLLEEGGSSSPENFQQLTGVLDYLNKNKESNEYLETILKIILKKLKNN